MAKPKYRFTPHFRGIKGLRTIYRQHLQIGIDYWDYQLAFNPVLNNQSGHIAVYKRTYRDYDNLLIWEPVKTIIVENGIMKR